MERIVGPCFKPEMQQVVDLSFPETGCAVLEENVFANRFPAMYKIHIHEYWMDKLRTYFLQNSDWIGRVFKSDSERAFSSDWFSMHEIDRDGKRGIKINMAITANRFHEARLYQDLQDLFTLFDLRIGLQYYKGTDDTVHLGDSAGPDGQSGAYQRYLAEKLCTNMCLQ